MLKWHVDPLLHKHFHRRFHHSMVKVGGVMTSGDGNSFQNKKASQPQQ
jgi:hypothetical protein